MWAEGWAFCEPDQLLSWSGTGGIRMHCLKSGHLLWSHPNLGLMTAAPKAKLFCCFDRGQFSLYRFEDRQVVLQWTHPENYLNHIALDPSGQYLVACGEDKDSWLYHCQSGQCQVRHSGSRSALYQAAFSEDGQFLAIVGDKTVRVYRPLESKPFLQLKGHKDKVLKVHFPAPDQLWTATQYHKERRLWQLPQGTCLDESPQWFMQGPGKISLKTPHPGLAVECQGQHFELMPKANLNMANCNQHFIALQCSYEMKIRLFPWNNLPHELQFQDGHTAIPTELTVHNNSVLSAGGNLLLRDPSDGKLLQVWQAPERANQITVSQDEKLCAYFIDYDLVLRRQPNQYSSASPHHLENWDLVFQTKGEHSIYKGWLHFSPHGRYLVSRSEGSRRSLRSVWSVWDTQEGRCLWTLKEWVHDGLLRFHPDGESFYCINEYTLARYCAKTGTSLGFVSLEGSKFSPQTRTFSADLSTVVSFFGDNTLWFWKLNSDLQVVKTGQFPQEALPASIPSKIALSHDRQRMAAARNDEVSILDLEQLTTHASLKVDNIAQLCWDGPELMVLHRDGSLTIWRD